MLDSAHNNINANLKYKGNIPDWQRSESKVYKLKPLTIHHWTRPPSARTTTKLQNSKSTNVKH